MVRNSRTKRNAVDLQTSDIVKSDLPGEPAWMDILSCRLSQQGKTIE